MNIHEDFLKICRCSDKTTILKYIDDNHPNVHYMDLNRNNAFIIACMYNKHPDVLEFLALELCIDVHRSNVAGNTGFLCACKDNDSLPVIQCLVERVSVQVNSVNDSYMNGFLLACLRNSNPDIIKYLIDDVCMDINHMNSIGQHGLMVACMRNSHVPVIEFLLTQSYDINSVDMYGNTCLMLACQHNTVVGIVEHLTTKTSIDITIKSNAGCDAFVIACNRNNKPIINYLMDHSKLCIEHLLSQTLVPMVINRISVSEHCFKHLLHGNLTNQKLLEIHEHLIKHNMPEYINHEFLKLTGLDDLEYDMIKKVATYIKYKIPCPQEKQRMIWSSPYFKKSIPDFLHDTSHPPLLRGYFKDVTAIVYGHQVIVYNMIPMLMIMKNSNCVEQNELIEIHVDVNSDVFLIYLEICYTGCIPESVTGKQIVELIMLVDMYPHALLTMPMLEPFICEDIPNESVEFLTYMCEQYELKYLTLMLEQSHN